MQFVHKLQTAVSEFCGYCRLFPHFVLQSEAIYSYIYIFDKCHQRFPLCVNRVVWTFVNLTWIHFAIFHCAIWQSCNDFMTSHIVKFALLYLVLFPPLPSPLSLACSFSRLVFSANIFADFFISVFIKPINYKQMKRERGRERNLCNPSTFACISCFCLAYIECTGSVCVCVCAIYTYKSEQKVNKSKLELCPLWRWRCS